MMQRGRRTIATTSISACVLNLVIGCHSVGQNRPNEEISWCQNRLHGNAGRVNDAYMMLPIVAHSEDQSKLVYLTSNGLTAQHAFNSH